MPHVWSDDSGYVRWCIRNWRQERRNCKNVNDVFMAGNMSYRVGESAYMVEVLPYGGLNVFHEELDDQIMGTVKVNLG